MPGNNVQPLCYTMTIDMVGSRGCDGGASWRAGAKPVAAMG